MSRLFKRRRSSGFRTSDLFRLVAMIGMLCIILMTAMQMRESSMWRWVVRRWEVSNGAEADEALRQSNIERQRLAVKGKDGAPLIEPAALPKAVDPLLVKVVGPAGIEPAAGEPAAVATAAIATPKRSELDPSEKQLLDNELLLIEDKTHLDGLEMGSYWRLLSWVKDQSTAELGQRARRDVLFTHLIQRPSQYRGELIHLKLNLKRSIRFEAGVNRLGVKWLYEAWGGTSDSHSYPYCIVFTDWPKGMPLGEGIDEEVTVDGYFLKHMRYESRDEKIRFAPLIVGRLNWHENPSQSGGSKQVNSNFIWIGVLVGMGAVVLGLGVWMFGFIFRPAKLVASTRFVDAEKVDDFLNDLNEPPNDEVVLAQSGAVTKSENAEELHS